MYKSNNFKIMQKEKYAAKVNENFIWVFISSLIKYLQTFFQLKFFLQFSNSLIIEINYF